MTEEELAGRLHVMEMRARFFQDENVRLRARIHEAVDECQRRFAPDIKELTRRRWLAVWAQDELDKYWTGKYSHVSTLGHSILENLMGRIKAAEPALELVRKLHSTRDQQWCDGCEQAAAARARQRLHQFEIAPRRGVDAHVIARGITAERTLRRGTMSLRVEIPPGLR